MSSDISYFFGKSIPHSKRHEIVDMHRMWGDFSFKDSGDLDEKIRLYDDGISCLMYNGDVSGASETWLIFTNGRNGDIPKTEKELRARADARGNTRVLVTITIKESARKERVNGERLAYIYLRHLLNYYSSGPHNPEFVITYSPDTDPAQKMHNRHGACNMDDDFLLVDARPNLVLEEIPAANVRPRGYKWLKKGSLYVSSQLKLAA